VLLFLTYLPIDVLKIFELKITESGIEKTYLITRQKKFIPFQSIEEIEQEKARYRNTRSYVTNGHFLSILKFKDGNSLVISPDYFENYLDLMLVIKGKIQ